MTSEPVHGLAAGHTDSLRTGQDWANWLRQVARSQFPGGLRQTGRAGVPIAWTALMHVARRQGFAVCREDCGNADGFTTWPDRRIHVREDAVPGHAVTALAHQIGHVLLHTDIAHLDAGGAVPCHGLRKVEADSVAYLTAVSLGIGAHAIGFPNVSAWAGTDPRAHPAATIRAVAGRVLAAADTILSHLETDLVPAGEGKPRTLTASAAQDLFGEPPPRAPVSDLARLNEIAARFFQKRLAGSWVPGYLETRGFSLAAQRLWGAGHAPAAWDALTRHLRSLGYPDTLIEASGLARRSRRGALTDTFRDRAMLPIRSADGTVVAFIGRAPAGAAPGVPKYLNSPGTGLFDKSEVLFGLWEAREALAAGARPVIAEGPLDAIAVTTASGGRHAGVSPCGTALTAQHAAALTRAASLSATGVLVAFDSDQAGRRAAVRAYHLLSPLTDEVTAVTLPPGQDPAQVLADRGPAALADMFAGHTQPLADLVVDAEVDRWSRWLGHAEGQINALRAAAPLVAAMPSSHFARQVARLADRLNLDHATVTTAVTDALPEVIARAQQASSRSQAQRGPPSLSPRGAHAARRDFPISLRQAAGQPTGSASRQDHPAGRAAQAPLRPGRVAR
jgi:DNA primase